jgi:hypothetical protein
MDEAAMKDLKSAFSLDQKDGGVTDALLGLREVTAAAGPVKKEDQFGQIKKPIYHPNPNISAIPINREKKLGRTSASPYYLPRGAIGNPKQLPEGFTPTTIRRVKEFTSLKIKLRQTDEFWEILAIAPDFEPKNINMQLVKYPSSQINLRTQVPAEATRDALLIEASKVILIHSGDGSVLEKNISARSLVPLGGFAKSEILGISQLANGITRIRILKTVPMAKVAEVAVAKTEKPENPKLL